MKWPLWCLQIEMIEVRTCVKINMWCQYVGHNFMWLVKWRDWYSGVRAIGPEYGRLYRFGLITYVYYACKLRGLSALSGERDSLLRCVGGVGEAGASYMNKWSNCNQELFLLFPSNQIKSNQIYSQQQAYYFTWFFVYTNMLSGWCLAKIWPSSSTPCRLHNNLVVCIWRVKK